MIENGQRIACLAVAAALVLVAAPGAAEGAFERLENRSAPLPGEVSYSAFFSASSDDDTLVLLGEDPILGGCSAYLFGDGEPVLWEWKPADRPAICFRITPGRDGDFFVRGAFSDITEPEHPAEPFFTARVDADGETVWLQRDMDIPEENLGGTYLEPSDVLVWQPLRNRILVTFTAGVSIGGSTSGFQHAAAYNDETGMLSRVLADFGNPSDGALIGTIALPNSRFLIGLDEIGTFLFEWDAFESLRAVRFDGIDLEEFAVSQMALDPDDKLALVAPPEAAGASLDEMRYFLGDFESGALLVDAPIHRLITVEIESMDEEGNPVMTTETISLDVPIDLFVGDDVMTMPHAAAGEIWFHAIDRRSGESLAIQPYSDMSSGSIAAAADIAIDDRFAAIEIDEEAMVINVPVFGWNPEGTSPNDALPSASGPGLDSGGGGGGDAGGGSPGSDGGGGASGDAGSGSPGSDAGGGGTGDGDSTGDTSGGGGGCVVVDRATTRALPAPLLFLLALFPLVRRRTPRRCQRDHRNDLETGPRSEPFPRRDRQFTQQSARRDDNGCRATAPPTR